MPALSTVQAGSTIIGSASGDSLIVAVGDEDRFGIGASVIVWPSGQPLEGATLYDTMDVIDKTDNTLTVLRNPDHALDTIAEGDQVGLSFRSSQPASGQQTQVVTWGKTGGDGPVIDLGSGALGVVSFIKATLSDVNLDGGTGDFDFEISALGSFDGANWGNPVNTTSGSYPQPGGSTLAFANFTNPSDPAPLYGHFFSARYLRFHAEWYSPVDRGVNASATATLELTYY